MTDTASQENGIRMACAFCKKRKLRCNKALPQCESCVGCSLPFRQWIGDLMDWYTQQRRFGYDCEYGPPKLLAKKDQKPNASTSHVKRIEDRLGKSLFKYYFCWSDWCCNRSPRRSLAKNIEGKIISSRRANAGRGGTRTQHAHLGSETIWIWPQNCTWVVSHLHGEHVQLSWFLILP